MSIQRIATAAASVALLALGAASASAIAAPMNADNAYSTTNRVAAPDPYTDGARISNRDGYVPDGAHGRADPFTDGARVTDRRDAFTDGA
ncbi:MULTISPECIES: hypothetical protein [unclassified Cupriavidus]|uniref:hypothetical protein n=1 Tax=unclassified Cupriavidus TaxID=2640874 RepID=UPI00313C9410